MDFYSVCGPSDVRVVYEYGVNLLLSVSLKASTLSGEHQWTYVSWGSQHMSLLSQFLVGLKPYGVMW
jgi:hypothetical protein